MYQRNFKCRWMSRGISFSYGQKFFSKKTPENLRGKKMTTKCWHMFVWHIWSTRSDLMAPYGDRTGSTLVEIMGCWRRQAITWTSVDFSSVRSRGIHFSMMTSSNGNIFPVTGPLCGEFTGPGEFPAQRPVTRSFDVFFDLRPNKRLSKQPWGRWFETPSWSLWRHCNGHSHQENWRYLLVKQDWKLHFMTASKSHRDQWVKPRHTLKTSAVQLSDFLCDCMKIVFSMMRISFKIIQVSLFNETNKALKWASRISSGVTGLWKIWQSMCQNGDSEICDPWKYPEYEFRGTIWGDNNNIVVWTRWLALCKRHFFITLSWMTSCFWWNIT